ncbi:hypothetical protein GCM10023322_13100 [Rugosimonospora acidiphila]|uniref:Neocarzinostatin family protein n=1 Tax=Rugosimonospora acidiphila TaxID=556531 RepID=A0ABP9RNH3_9ACTN
MKFTRRHTLLLASGAVALGATVAFALPAGAAVVDQSPPAPVLKLGATANLQANGAVVFVPVKVTCQPGASAYLSVTVTENVGGGFIASGSGSTDSLTCTGHSQTVNEAVVPTQRAFAKGVAFAQTQMSVCGSVDCARASDQRVIQIVK